MTYALSIIVVNWNTKNLVAQCLRSLEHLNLEYEVIVVDNGSTDGSAATIREDFPSVQLLENRTNVGFACANNQALCRARGRYALLLNSDTLSAPGAIETLVNFMDAHPKAGACGPRLLNPDGTLQPSTHPIITPIRELWRLMFLDKAHRLATYPMDQWDVQMPRPVEVIKGACLALRNAALDQIGMLDETYFMYTEEVDLCYRLAKAGWECWWVPQATIIHYGEASSKQIRSEMFSQLYRSKVHFFRKYGGESQAAGFKCLLAVAYWPRLLFASTAGLVLPSFRDRARTFGRMLRELPDF